MARLYILSIIILALPLFLHSTLSINPPTASPAPSPSVAASPPSPLPPSDLSPSPTPSFTDPRNPPALSPTPPPLAPVAPSVPPAADEVTYTDRAANTSDSSSSSGGRTAGIVIGVVAGACVVFVGGKVYKKRKDNIRRSRYRNSSREDFL